MSLILDESTVGDRPGPRDWQPRRPEAKTGAPCSCHREGVWIMERQTGTELWISNGDFVELMKYFLTNTALGETDPRPKFVEWAKRLQVVKEKGRTVLKD